MTGWQAVVQAMKAEGITHLYGMPSSPKDLYDDLYDEPSITTVQVRHEAAGGFMAMAHALASGSPAACFTSAGPGLANLVPAVLEAHAACAPVLFFCPGTAGDKAGRGAFQETDQMGIMKPITKWAFRISTPEQVPWAMRRAFSLMVNGQPGPVYLELPPEAGRKDGEIPPYIPAGERLRPWGDPADIDHAAELIRSASKPVIVAGGGCRRSKAHDELRSLAELTGMAVFTTPSGRGSIEEDHPLSCGQVGLYRTRLGIDVFSETDLMITVGSRNEEFQTLGWSLLPEGAQFIQIDIESFEMGRNYIPDVPVLGDARVVLSQLHSVLSQHPDPAWDLRRRALGERTESFFQQVSRECLTDENPVKSKRVVHEIGRVFGRNTIMVHENGSQDLWSYFSPYYRVLDRDGDIGPGEQTCMGAGVMGAVGAKLAKPERQVVCVTGDGAFQMYNQDVPTALQQGAPVTWVILNSSSLGWPKRGQRALGDRFIAVDFTVQPDFLAMARSYGCWGARITEPGEIEQVLRQAQEQNRQGMPALVDVIIDPDEVAEGFLAYERNKG